MSEAKPLLQFEHVDTYYGQIHILQDSHLVVGEGELVCLLGGNASGKSTTLKTTLGIVKPRTGRVLFDGEDVTGQKTSYRIGRGMAIVPENRRLFGDMSVRENLELGATLRRGEDLSEDFDRVHSLFPRLHERKDQLACTLSGGEQQMVAMGRALMSKPKLLLMDEPSEGLAPVIVQQLEGIIASLRQEGLGVLLVEQNLYSALAVADRVFILETGKVVHQGTPAEIEADTARLQQFLGVH